MSVWKREESCWVQERGKDEGGSSSRDAEGAQREASDFQQPINPYYIIKNQEVPQTIPDKNARGGFLGHPGQAQAG